MCSANLKQCGSNLQYMMLYNNTDKLVYMVCNVMYMLLNQIVCIKIETLSLYNFLIRDALTNAY